MEEVLFGSTPSEEQVAMVRQALPGATFSALPTTPDEVADLHEKGIRRLAADSVGLWSRSFHDRKGTWDRALARQAVLKAAVAHGWSLDVTLCIGQGERVAERLEHLRMVEAFHEEHGLTSFRVWAAEAGGKPAGSSTTRPKIWCVGQRSRGSRSLSRRSSPPLQRRVSAWRRRALGLAVIILAPHGCPMR